MHDMSRHVLPRLQGFMADRLEPARTGTVSVCDSRLGDELGSFG